MTERFPIQLVIEVSPLFDDVDRIELVAYVSGERQVIAECTDMTGYQAKNNPRMLVRLLLRDLET